jgi:hypothetical protein
MLRSIYSSKWLFLLVIARLESFYGFHTLRRRGKDVFGEFRRKVRSAEVLSAAMEKLLSAIHFTGRVSIVVQNGRVLKSGYEEGYFRNHAGL